MRADQPSMPDRDRRRSSFGRPAVARVSSIALLTLTLAVACGNESPSDDDATSPQITVVVTTEATTTTQATTTIDFDRPIEEGTDPLPAGAEPATIVEWINDLRGRTDNVARQTRRLGPFPDPIPSPQLAQIVDISVEVEVERDDLNLALTTVRYRVPYDGDVVEGFLSDALRSVGWIRLDERDVSSGGINRLQRTYRLPGQRADGIEFIVVVETGDGPTIVEQSQRSATADALIIEDRDTYLSRLSEWTDVLPLPRRAQLDSISISTSNDRAVLEARHLLDVDTASDAADDVLDAAAGDYERAGTVLPLELIRTEDRLPISVSFTDSRDDEPIVIISTVELPLIPLD